MTQHEQYMKRCIELAKKGMGFVSPNPMVGSVIVRNNEIISEGFHKVHGGAHAEANAIANAKSDLTGATLYCNLEPCSHRSSEKINPPCTEAIIAAGISKVVIASEDLNPKVFGNGIAALKSAGIEVVQDVLKAECLELNRVFFHHIQKKRPYIILKMAQSLDGFVAMKNGESKWITELAAREEVHRYRSEFDAILTTSATVIVDNPSLTLRHIEGRMPKRFVIDRNNKLNKDFAIFDKAAESAVFAKQKHDFAKTIILNSDNEVENFQEMLESIYSDFSCRSILIECGSRYASFLVKNKLVDEVILMIAPKLLGEGKSAFADLGVEKLSDAVEFYAVSYSQIGDTLIVKGKCKCSLDS